MLVAPAAAARGLDFANVSHVYTLGFQPADAAEYAHIAGRTGRVGQAGRGVVNSLLKSADEMTAHRVIVEGDLGRKLLVGATVAPDDLLGSAGSEDVDEVEERIRRLEESLLIDVELEDDQDEDA